MKWAVIFLALALSQEKPDPVKIPRSEGANYRKLVNEFKTAVAQSGDDPQSCLETCNKLINEITANPDKYSKIRDSAECSLRIEAPQGGYGDPVPFTPYLYRGRARLALIKASQKSDVPNALKEMDKVMSDLKFAVDHGSDAQGDIAAATEKLKAIKTLGGAAEGPATPIDDPARTTFDALKDKLDVDPKATIALYDKNSDVLKSSRYAAESVYIRLTAVLLDKVNQKDYPGVVKYCDETAAFVKGSVYAARFDRERRAAVEEIEREKDRLAREMMAGLRSLLAAGEYDKVLERYDKVAAAFKTTEYAAELERIRKEALDGKNSGAEKLVLMKLDPLEAMLNDSSSDAAKVLEQAALLAPTVKDTPKALQKLDQIRTRAKTRLQNQWSRLCDDKRFASATKLVEASSKHLAETELKQWTEEIRKRCASYLVATQKSVQSGLADALRPPSPYDTLAAYSAEDLRRILSVPDAGELVFDPDPALAWSAEFRRSLEAVLAGGDPGRISPAEFLKMLEQLNASVVASVPLVAGGEANPYFKGAEGLSVDLAKRRLSAVVDLAKPAGRDKRKEFREQGDAVLKSMTGMFGRVDLALQKTPDKGKAFNAKVDLTAHKASIDEIWKRFPIDVDRIGKIWEELFGQPSKGAYGATPLSDLEVREKELWTLYDSSWGSLAVESRKELVRCLMVTTVMHHLLAGRKAQDVAQADDVRKEKRLAGEVGGLTDQDLKGISPKVRKVIEAAKP